MKTIGRCLLPFQPPPLGTLASPPARLKKANQKETPPPPPAASDPQPHPFGVRWQSEARAPTPLSAMQQLPFYSGSPGAAKAVSPGAHCVARPLPPHSKATRRPNVVPSLPQPYRLYTPRYLST
jgi:hypothetical protein